jgi:hypothetical protein
MGEDGILVGEIAHIEAAMPDGPRFRKEMTNEERRAFANLLLLCGVHHTKVDHKKNEWSVGRLTELKKKHEAIYTNVAEKLRSAIVDETEGNSWTLPSNLNGITSDVGFGLSPEQLEAEIELVDRLARRLASLSVNTREVLALIINRGKETSLQGEFEITLALLKSIASGSDNDLHEQLIILEETKFIWIDPDERPLTIIVRVALEPEDWKLFQEIKTAAAGNPEQVRRVLVELDFTVLEGT